MDTAIKLDSVPEPEESSSGKYDVFISHHSAGIDSDISRALATALDQRGITNFLDTRILLPGDDFEQYILECIEAAKLVIVFFHNEPSSWVLFEAACAFFDRKLIPISVDASAVPQPYNRLEFEKLTTASSHGNEGSVERIADEVERRLHGRKRDRAVITLVQGLNRFFYRGLQISLGIFLVTVFIIAAYDKGTRGLDVHLNHLHVFLGSTILGGQFFVSLAFARAIASPIYPARDTVFRTAERLFLFWFVLAPFQPILGMWLATIRFHSPNNWPGWVWLAIVLYLTGLLLTLTGYLVAKTTREADSTLLDFKSSSMHNLLANMLLTAGFVSTVLVISLMLSKGRLF